MNFLRSYRAEDRHTAKLTLIESVPFPTTFKELANSFHHVSFEHVFRNAKLVSKEQAFQSSSNQQSYANTIALPKVPGPQVRTALAVPRTSDSKSSHEPSRKIQLNRYDQRIDEPIRFWDEQITKQLRQRSLCPRYFLTECKKSQCSKSHAGSIGNDEKRALTRIAREDPCERGTHCYERNCVSAHHCIYDGRCSFGSSCRYGPNMHGIDKAIANIR